MARCLPRGRASRAFTILEVAIIVAIIGMMLMIILGYLFAPKPTGPLPPVAATTPIPPESTPPTLVIPPTPAKATPPATPSATPARTLELSPRAQPALR